MKVTDGRAPTVLFYIHALAGGGAERVMARLASGYARRGHRVVLVVDYPAGEWLSALDERIELIELPGGHLRSTLALADLLSRLSPDISLSALSAANLKHLVAALLAGRHRNAILSYHGFAENEPQKLSKIGYWLTPVFTRLAARSVVVSDALRDDLIRRFYASRARLGTVYNPASPASPQAPVSAEELAAREPIVIAIGRLVSDKGFLFLLNAFAKVPCREAKLIMLGKGPELERLKAEAERLNIGDRVEFAGYVTDTSAYLSKARCFVSPSYRESFGLAIIEALDFGLAVVATDSGGPAEILNSAEFGRIVPVGDEDAMAAAISASLAAPGDPAARQKRSRDFTLDAAMKGYDRIFAEVAPSFASEPSTA
jgi:glycosyltransferase involved in cell wall biosynthesis